jgi:hypothetical protein
MPYLFWYRTNSMIRRRRTLEPPLKKFHKKSACTPFKGQPQWHISSIEIVLMKKLIMSLFVFLCSTVASAMALDHCVYVLGPNHRNLLPAVYERFQADHPEDICPVRFDVEDDASKSCRGTEPGGEVYFQKGARAVLEYRNMQGNSIPFRTPFV